MSEAYISNIHEQVIDWLQSGDTVNLDEYDLDASAENIRHKLDAIAHEATARYPDEDDDDERGEYFGYWSAMAWQSDDWLVKH